MAEAVQQVLDESTSKKGRKSYSREKLKVVKCYHDSGINLYKNVPKVFNELKIGDGLGER